MLPLQYVIEHGSFTSQRDLKGVIIALNRRVKRIRKQLSKPQADINSLLDELHRANIFRDEFRKLKDQL
jgi:hypothetical protein